MILFSLLGLLPDLFKITMDTTKLFDGTATEEEWRVVLDDLSRIVNNIPELKGFTVLISGLIKVVEFSLPLLKDAMKQQSLIDMPVKPEDVIAAEASLRILRHMAEKVDERAKDVYYSGHDLKTVFDRTDNP